MCVDMCEGVYRRSTCTRNTLRVTGCRKLVQNTVVESKQKKGKQNNQESFVANRVAAQAFCHTWH